MEPDRPALTAPRPSREGVRSLLVTIGACTVAALAPWSWLAAAGRWGLYLLAIAVGMRLWLAVYRWGQMPPRMWWIMGETDRLRRERDAVDEQPGRGSWKRWMVVRYWIESDPQLTPFRFWTRWGAASAAAKMNRSKPDGWEYGLRMPVAQWWYEARKQ